MKLKCTPLKYYNEDYVAISSTTNNDINSIVELLVELGEEVITVDSYNIIVTQSAIFLIEIYIPDATIKD